MTNKNEYDDCECGKLKKKDASYCRGCFLSSIRKGYECQLCGIKRKKTTSKFCKECRYKSFVESVETSTIEEKSYDNGSPQNRYGWIRFHARKKMENKKSCQCCGFSAHVEVCHIKPIGDFPKNATISEVNSFENLVILCPNCHWLFDNGYNSIDKLKEFYKK